jgi:hypothetical protein
MDDLWLRFPLTDFHFAFRQRIEVEREMPSFGHDPRSGVYSKLEWFKHTFGEPSLQYLNVWQRSIFIQGGNDGVEEHIWALLAYELRSRADELKTGRNLLDALRVFHESQERQRLRLKERLANAERGSLSQWDTRAISAEQASLEGVLTTVNLICTRNVFVQSWHEACTSKGSSFLEELFELARRLVADDSTGRFIFSEDTLPFPSSWEIELGGILRDTNAAYL